MELLKWGVGVGKTGKVTLWLNWWLINWPLSSLFKVTNKYSQERGMGSTYLLLLWETPLPYPLLLLRNDLLPEYIKISKSVEIMSCWENVSEIQAQYAAPVPPLLNSFHKQQWATVWFLQALLVSLVESHVKIFMPIKAPETSKDMI